MKICKFLLRSLLFILIVKIIAEWINIFNIKYYTTYVKYILNEMVVDFFH